MVQRTGPGGILEQFYREAEADGLLASESEVDDPHDSKHCPLCNPSRLGKGGGQYRSINRQLRKLNLHGGRDR